MIATGSARRTSVDAPIASCHDRRCVGQQKLPNEADIIRELQRRHLNYAIGKTIGARQRFYAFRTEGRAAHVDHA